MPLKTTVIGAWPKVTIITQSLENIVALQPDYLNIPDWFSEKGNFKEDVLSGLTGMGGGFDPRSASNIVRDQTLEENIKRAASEVIEEQVKLGIDVITDGEVERGNKVCSGHDNTMMFQVLTTCTS